jgi:hypothetical protein
LDPLNGLIVRAFPELVVEGLLCGAAARAEDGVPGFWPLLKVPWRWDWILFRLWFMVVALPVEVRLPVYDVYVTCRPRRPIGWSWEGG